MSDFRGMRGPSEDSEDSEDIFQSTFSNSNSGKVKISGGGDNHVGLATAKLTKAEPSTQPEKSDPVKQIPNEHHNQQRQQPHQPAPTPQQHHVTFHENNPIDQRNLTNRMSNMHLPPGGQSSRAPLVQRAFSEQSSPNTRAAHCQTRDDYESSPEEQEEEEDAFIEISLSEPHKVGEGISSYLAYRVATRTNLRCFSQQQFTVSRRFSDFLGLHEKLSDKHLPRGRVIPPAPEKSLVGTTKVKMSSGSAGGGEAAAESNGQIGGGGGTNGGQQQGQPTDQAEFIARRRFALERFINRVGQHPVLRRDSIFVEFLQSSRELPRATSTSALSSASVFRLLGRVGDTVNKITYKMEENDPWYEEKVQQIDALESQLKRLYGIVESLVQCRHELAVATGSFAQGTAMLSNTEEAHSLSRALAHLSRVEEKVEQVHHHQAEADYYYLFELIKDYVALVGAVKDVLTERSKAFQNWQHAQSMVIKKKEQRARLEMGGRTDKIPAANDEVLDWEARLEENQDNFNRISRVIKVEIDLFERYRVKDFKVAILQYLEALMNCQLQLVKHWEDFLPEVKSILF